MQTVEEILEYIKSCCSFVVNDDGTQCWLQEKPVFFEGKTKKQITTARNIFKLARPDELKSYDSLVRTCLRYDCLNPEHGKVLTAQERNLSIKEKRRKEKLGEALEAQKMKEEGKIKCNWCRRYFKPEFPPQTMCSIRCAINDIRYDSSNFVKKECIEINRLTNYDVNIKTIDACQQLKQEETGNPGIYGCIYLNEDCCNLYHYELLNDFQLNLRMFPESERLKLAYSRQGDLRTNLKKLWDQTSINGINKDELREEIAKTKKDLEELEKIIRLLKQAGSGNYISFD